MPFNIIRDDITRLDMDAIVNAANSRLAYGGGVCGAIFSAAGAAELQAECDKIGYCETGGAVITNGYNLKAKYIIHTVGPIYGENPKEEEKQLYSCYKNSLELAAGHKLESIAFPLISSGIYGYPKAEALKIATKAIKDFLAENDMDVYLVVYDKASFHISEKLFDSVKSYIDDKLIKPDSRRCLCDEGVSVPLPCLADKEYDYIPEGSTLQGAPSAKIQFEKKESLDALLNKKTETFSEMLLRLIDERGMSDVEVYKRANIDRKLFSKMRKKDYMPKKTTVMALVISLKLGKKEAEMLLNRAGFAFSESSKFDIIIEYFIENGIYDIYEINEALFAFEEKLLGA
ncbi:MAG: macro domain-containing protein [Clostridia bacterium]|nr:macro domain-containing protein [Clostridia bacterium]